MDTNSVKIIIAVLIVLAALALLEAVWQSRRVIDAEEKKSRFGIVVNQWYRLGFSSALAGSAIVLAINL